MQKPQNVPRWTLKKSKNKSLFAKVRTFSVLDEGDCQKAWLLAHLCPFGRQRRARPDGADPPHFRMHTGKIGQFFKKKGFRRTQVKFGGDGPHNTAGDLQNTPRTPAMHFPLAASGSQSALYVGWGLGKAWCSLWGARQVLPGVPLWVGGYVLPDVVYVGWRLGTS